MIAVQRGLERKKKGKKDDKKEINEITGGKHAEKREKEGRKMRMGRE